MPSNNYDRYVYWDSNVFLAFLNAELGRVDIIETIWDEISQIKDARIVTSAVSIVEVAYVKLEKDRKALDPQVAARLDALWQHPSLLMMDNVPLLMYEARELVREAMVMGWKQTPLDSIHLASAKWVHEKINPVSEINTYEGNKWLRLATLLNIPINEPKKSNPILPTETQLTLPEETQ